MWPLGIAAGLLVAGMLLQASRPIGHDLAWLLIATGRLLDGADVFGREVFEWNPPANVLVLVPSVLAARWLPLSPITAVRFELLAIAAASLWLTARLLVALAPRGGRRAASLWVAALAFAFFVLPGDAFGQREHVVAMLFAPHLVLVAMRAGGREVPRGLALASGAAVALALCVKPQYVLVWLAFEVLLLARRRDPRVLLRADTATVAAVGVTYLATVALLFPAYLTTIAPMARDTYWVYQAYLARIVDPAEWLLIPIGALSLLAVGGSGPRRDLAVVLVVAAAAFYAVALLQRTGWPYHFLPLQTVFVAQLGLVAARFGADVDALWPRREVAAVIGALGFVAAIAGLLLAPTGYARTFAEGAAWRCGEVAGHVAGLVAFLERHAPGGSVFVVSPSLVTVSPAVLHTGVGWTSRFAGFYMPAAIERSRRGDAQAPARLTPARADEIERFLRDAVIEDLAARPPDLILVDRVKRRKVFAGVPFDLLAYLREDPRFEAVWADYRTVGRIGRFEAAVRR